MHSRLSYYFSHFFLSLFFFLLLFQVESIRAVFKKELDIPIVEIADPNAKLDGGDVLFTGKTLTWKNSSENHYDLFSIKIGKEFFVGLSQWTNEAGAKAVAAAFPEYPCVPIKVCIPFTRLAPYGPPKIFYCILNLNYIFILLRRNLIFSVF